MIKEKTDILPHVVADMVCMEVCRFTDSEKPMGFSEALTERAERCFAKGGQFAKLLKRRDGRDTLYAFMRHWVSAMVKETMGDGAYKKLPATYCVGVEPA